MSRIGKKTIEIPAGVTVDVKESTVNVKGPKGELTMQLHPAVTSVVEGNTVKISLKNENKNLYPFWGLSRALIANMISGVSKGFEKRLELVGVGYRAKQNGTDGVLLTVGFSHPVDFKAPAGVQIEVPDNTNIIIKGVDKQLVGLTAANIRKIRKPEPYKGKGIKYLGEVIRRKAGKAGKTAK